MRYTVRSKILPRKLNSSERVAISVGAFVIISLFMLSAFSEISIAYDPGSSVLHSSAATNSSTLCSVTSGGQEEEYIPTYAVNAQNHAQAYAITGANIYQNVVDRTNDKVYLLVHVHTATTFAINTSGTTASCSDSLRKQTDNIYWDAQDGTTGSRDFATVGGDLVTDSSTGLMLFDQYINVNSAPGGNAPNAPSASSVPSCYVDTSGQERNSVYMLFVDDQDIQHSYVITGTSIAQISVGGVESTDFYVYLSSTTIGTGTSPGKTNACSMTLSKGNPDFEWAVRAPPPGAPVSGNYEIYGTLGANCPPNNEGTNAGIIEQFTNPSYQFS